MSNPNISNPGRVPTAGRAEGLYHDKRIQAALSTQILIKTQGYDGLWYDVGAIQSFQVNENRNLNPLQEVGTDGVIQIHPNGAQPVSLSVTRAVFDYKRLTVAFQRGFHHIMSQRFPFDIVVCDYNPHVFGTGNRHYDASRAVSFDQADTSRVVRTRFLNCWFASNSYTYNSDQYLISEQATIQAEAVYDTNLDGVQLSESGQDIIEAEHDRTKFGSVMTEAYAVIGNIETLNA